MDIATLQRELTAFAARNQLGEDPLAKLYPERRKAWSLFARGISDKECEALRPYVLTCAKIPQKPGDPAPRLANFIDGTWRAPARGEFASMKSQADRRVTLFELPASTSEDVEAGVSAGDRYWKSMAWAEEGLGYRKLVIQNFSRLLEYFYEECIHELRQQTPKTKLEADKDFFEAKRAADHLQGNAETALRGEMVPQMVPGQSYWRDSYLPAGLAAIITPMNFIYGIPAIHLVGAYLSGCPFIFKGHPFSGLTNTTLIRLMLAAGADPHQLQKVEGFGKGVSQLAADPRVAVVAVTGSADTARAMQTVRGLQRLRFEGGGCNWSYVDDGYSKEELTRIAERLTYSKLGLSSHKCTGLHGVAGSKKTLDVLLPLIDAEMGRWEVRDPRGEGTKVVGPLMVHKAQTAIDLVAAAKRAGLNVVRAGERGGGTWGENAEVVGPSIIAGVTPATALSVDWDGKGVRNFHIATEELFMPVLVAMELASFDDFVRFSLFENPHDLATSIWTRDDAKLQRARRRLGGMLKENDGTDSALEWEEFGASTIGESGNMGVGEAQATLSIYARRQKGRHFVF